MACQAANGTDNFTMEYPRFHPLAGGAVTAHLVWIDLEMTGLDPDRDVILEIATIITDGALREVAVGPDVVIAASRAQLEAMDEWNQSHHGASGLIERVRRSPHAMADAERLTLDFVQQHVAAATAPLCGNTIWQDRRFLARHMPALEGHLHYRNIDVSSIKELARRWRPGLAEGFVKRNAHRALADIRESIAELAYYREHFFRL